MKTLALVLAPLTLLTAAALAQDAPPTEKTGEAPPAKKTGEAPPAKKTGEAPPAKKAGDPPAKTPDSAEPVAVTLATTKAKVAVGEAIEVTVTVKNITQAPVLVRPIALTRFSLALKVSSPSRKTPFLMYTFPGGIQTPKVAEQTALKPGESISGKVTVPTVRVGKLSLEGRFIGHIAPLERGAPPPKVRPKILKSNKLDVEVVPTEAGGTVCIARIETKQGRIDIKFHDDHAPNTVLSFIRHAQAKKYDGTLFHRVIAGFMIQGGDPKGDGTGGPGYGIPAEFSPTLRHKPGAVAMARTGNPHSAGCQFYICLGSPSHLDQKYAIFGQVIEGHDVVKKIGAMPVAGPGNRPTEDQAMTKVTIEVVKSLPK